LLRKASNWTFPARVRQTYAPHQHWAELFLVFLFQVPIPTDLESALECAARPEEIRIRLPPPVPTSMIQGKLQKLAPMEGQVPEHRVIGANPVTWHLIWSSELQMSKYQLAAATAERKEERRRRLERAKARLRAHDM
jgi:hypothetical protein